MQIATGQPSRENQTGKSLSNPGRFTIPIGPFGAITAAALLHELLHRMTTAVDAVHNARRRRRAVVAPI